MRAPFHCATAEMPHSSLLFSDAEPPEDVAQKVVGGVLAGNAPQRLLRHAQLFGEKLDLWKAIFCRREMNAGFCKRAKVAFSGNEHIFCRMPDGNPQQFLLQKINTGPASG